MRKEWFWVAVVVACAMAVIVSRITGARYFFLVWNIFLALIPVFVGILYVRLQIQWKQLLLLPFVAFFPNAIYVWTDIIHPFRMIKYTCSTEWEWNGLWSECTTPLVRELVSPSWFGTWQQMSTILTVSIAIAVSLFAARWGWNLMTQTFDAKKRLLFGLLLALATSFGVVLGRFARTNSWELVSAPARVASDVVWTMQNLFLQPIFQLFFVITLVISLPILLLPPKHEPKNPL